MRYTTSSLLPWLGGFHRAGLLALLPLCCALLLAGCEEPVLTPKERAYPKVLYPERGYRAFSDAACGFTFEYPVYAQIQRDAGRQEGQAAHPCWFDIHVPAFDSRIHCSYFPITASQSLEKLKAEAFELAGWHNKRANYIDELIVSRPEHKVYGFIFEIEGAAASPYQFYLTDSTSHFLRGALYFNTQARPDSLAPIVAFTKEDVLHLVETLRW